MARRIQALLLDLDGTLIDSAPDLHAALTTLLGELGRPALGLAEARRLIGDGPAVMVQRALERTGGAVPDAEMPALVQRYLALYEADIASLTRPYPGVPGTLAALAGQGLALGVCTNKPTAAARQVLQALGLDQHLSAIAGGDRYGVRKPDPGHLLGLLQDLGAQPEDAVMIGDNEHDSAAGRAAGLPFILVTYGYARTAHAEISADRTIDRFAAVPEALAAIAGGNP